MQVSTHPDSSAHPASTLVLGIRREDKSRWERRVPLNPEQVHRLVSAGFKVLVQPSGFRVFPDEQYRQVGATVTEDLQQADLILGVKEVRPDLLIPNKAYVFFSHVIKAQPYNMNLLDELLKKKILHMDYESIKDEKGDRLVKFGKFAGNAGVMDFLSGLGNRLLALGHSTPFLELGMSYMYPNIAGCKEALNKVGRQIQQFGLPKKFGPLTFCITGEGAVSQGAYEMLKELPHQLVQPYEFQRIVEEKKDQITREIYVAFSGPGTSCVSKDPARKYSLPDFIAHPEEYQSVFHEKIAPYCSCIINGTYWDEKFPRLLTNEQMNVLHKEGRHRLLGLADISADLGGSIQFMDKITTLDEPYCVHDFDAHTNHGKMTAAVKDGQNRGCLIMSIDHLPTELAKEASTHFGDMLIPFILGMEKVDFKAPLEQTGLPKPLQAAVITKDGKLTPRFAYIAQLRRQREISIGAATKRITVFGAGRCSGPLVDYLSRYPEYKIVLGDANFAAAQDLAKRYPCVVPVQVDVADEGLVERHVQDCDIVVSMLPWVFHASIAKVAIKHRKHMVTASYINPNLRAMHKDAELAGVTCLNEVGLDPGIDHCSAMKIIDEARAKGHKVEGFTSWCGGLPAPEDSDNPFGYKFSWSPRGVLLATRNSCRFRQGGEIVELPSDDLLSKGCRQVPVMPGFTFEGYPNRDSVSYEEHYSITGVKDMLRGTLRFPGYCALMQAFKKIGFFSLDNHPALAPDAPVVSWRAFLEKLVPATAQGKTLEERLVNGAGLAENPAEAQRFLDALRWLGLLGDKPVPRKGTPLDALCVVMEELMQYGPNERDLVILYHIFALRDAQGHPYKATSTLIAYGDPKGYSAMAKTVGTPAAIGVHLVAKGIITRKGMVAPLTPDVYLPILEHLAKENIVPIERAIH